jgi:hypothetical protein
VTSASQITSALTFKVIGACTSDSGVLTAVGSGFTPDATYTTEVWYPDGKEYTNFNPVGTASSTGATPDWKWPCGPYGDVQVGDPAGTYKVRVTDNTSGRQVTTTFTINKP